jgi:hypothetical protein
LSRLQQLGLPLPVTASLFANQGVVHYHLDTEFQRTATAPLMLLDNPRYGAVRAEYTEAFRRLDASSPDLKEALRRLFEVNEIAFKLLTKAEGKDPP